MIFEWTWNKKSYFPFSEKTHFTTKPSSLTVRENQNVILSCKAAGFPKPIITWYKNGRVIEHERKQFEEGHLEFRNILIEDRGLYTCTAENILGREKITANITVQGLLNEFTFQFISLHYRCLRSTSNDPTVVSPRYGLVRLISVSLLVKLLNSDWTVSIIDIT